MYIEIRHFGRCFFVHSVNLLWPVDTQCCFELKGANVVYYNYMCTVLKTWGSNWSSLANVLSRGCVTIVILGYTVNLLVYLQIKTHVVVPHQIPVPYSTPNTPSLAESPTSVPARGYKNISHYNYMYLTVPVNAPTPVILISIPNTACTCPLEILFHPPRTYFLHHQDTIFN